MALSIAEQGPSHIFIPSEITSHICSYIDNPTDCFNFLSIFGSAPSIKHKQRLYRLFTKSLCDDPTCVKVINTWLRVYFSEYNFSISEEPKEYSRCYGKEVVCYSIPMVIKQSKRRKPLFLDNILNEIEKLWNYLSSKNPCEKTDPLESIILYGLEKQLDRQWQHRLAGRYSDPGDARRIRSVFKHAVSNGFTSCIDKCLSLDYSMEDLGLETLSTTDDWLYKACKRADTDLCAWLMQHDALYSERCLLAAIKLDSVEIVDQLIEKYDLSFSSTTNTSETDPLFVAAVNDSCAVIAKLVGLGFNVNNQTLDGQTPLHGAVSHGKFDAVQTLLAFEAKADVVNAEGVTPFRLALQKGHIEIVKLLTQMGAHQGHGDKELWEDICTSKFSYPESYLDFLFGDLTCWTTDKEHEWTPLHIAASKGSKEIIALLLSKGIPPLIRTCDGSTPLHQAVSFGHVKLPNEFIQDPIPWYTLDHSGLTPLHRLVLLDKKSGSHLSCIKTLVNFERKMIERIRKTQVSLANKIDDINLKLKLLCELLLIKTELSRVSTKFCTSESILRRISTKFCTSESIECEQIYWDIIRLAPRCSLERLPRNITDVFGAGPGITAVNKVDGCRALHYAMRGPNTLLAQKLLSYGSGSDARSFFGRTPLHEAARSGNICGVHLLLERGVDINAKRVDLVTPLYEAALGGYVEIVKLLIEHGADVYVQNGKQDTPLHEAARAGNAEIVKLLIDNGAPNDVQNGKQDTPLHEAVRNGNTEIVKLLIDHGADVDVQNRKQDTPLHDAVRTGNVEVVKPLIERGAPVDVQNKIQDTPLHEAVRNGNVEIVKLLIEHGASVGVQNKTQDTPLHEAVRAGNVEIVKLLIQHGASVGVQNRKQHTPLHEAASSGSIECARLLLPKVETIDLNAKGKDRKTPLSIAIYKEDIEMLELLIEWGAPLCNTKTKDNSLSIAASKGAKKSVFEILIKAGAIPNNAQTQYNTLTQVFENFSSLRVLEIAQVLLNAGAKPVNNRRDSNTLYRARGCDETIIRLLREAGAKSRDEL